MKTKIVAAVLVALLSGGGITFAILSPRGGTLGEASASDALATDAGSKAITIYSDPTCGCCTTYADYLEANGYQVTRVDDRNFAKRSIAAGVPEQGLGCHLAEIDGYYVSGLVPAEIINRLVTERPEITGITLPGMPGNAPGMALKKTGILKTFAFGEDGVSVYSNE